MRIVPAALLALGLASCVVPVTEHVWQTAPHAPKPGDLVRVETTEGKQHVFRIYKTDDHAFYGTASDNEQYRVPYKVVKNLWVRKTETEWEAIDPLLFCCAVY